MNGKKHSKIIWFTLLALIFLILAGMLWITVGKNAREALVIKIRMAVEAGAPVSDYIVQDTRAREGVVEKNEAALPSLGSRYGVISCNRIGLNAPLYYGDSEDILLKGAGQYTGSAFPGEGRPILVGAHDIGYFEALENVQQGDRINVETSYGIFQYQVTDIRIGYASDIGTKELEHLQEELILYTCYPFGALTEKKSKRYFVAAEKIEGPVLTEETDEGK